MTLSADNQVAVFIDYENIALSCRDKLTSDTEIDWSRVLETAVDLGRVVIRRAYANWAAYSASQRELLGLGVDLIHVPAKRGKNAADIRIVIDALEMLMGEHTNVSHVLLVSGDGDFTELVHRLRAHGKIVVGLGVSGASAEYLINACDQFIFYDLLLGAEQQPAAEEEGEPAPTTFDVSEARQLLRRVLQTREGEWISGGKLKNAMLRLDPAFSERNYSYSSFKEFLAAQSDLVRLRTAHPGGHLEVQTRPAQEVSTEPAPEVLLDRYLDYLAQQKVRMTPTEHRPVIIFKFYELYRAFPDRSLTELKEELHAFFEEAAPNVKWQYVHEVIHQLFHTYCFEFDQTDGDYPPDVRLWDHNVKLVDTIKRAPDLLDRCDRGLLQKIARKMGSAAAVDREVAARLLYGSVRGEKMLDHVDQLLREPKKD
jgi:hypothetical protein